MPKVGDKHFEYTKAGKQEAKKHAEKTGQKVEHSGPYMKSSGFKMKGSPFQRNFGIGSPIKERSQAYDFTGDMQDFSIGGEGGEGGHRIPSFRDFVSLEQQQAYADKVDKRRADKKLDRQMQKDLKEESTPENIRKKRDKMSNIVQKQQRKTLKSQQEMDKEGPKVDLSKHVVNQPLTLPKTKTS